MFFVGCSSISELKTSPKDCFFFTEKIRTCYRMKNPTASRCTQHDNRTEQNYKFPTIDYWVKEPCPSETKRAKKKVYLFRIRHRDPLRESSSTHTAKSPQPSSFAIKATSGRSRSFRAFFFSQHLLTCGPWSLA